MLVAFPIALLGLTPLWDGLARAGIMADARLLAHHGEAVGLIGAGLAVITGFAELLKIPASEAATARAALIHAGLALTMISLFGVAFALRGSAATLPSAVVLALDLAGALGLGATGWFGGDLVFQRGVGVKETSRPRSPERP
jgi:uncharacterized membrane protein